MWYYILIYRYIYIYLWFNSFKDTSVLISLQGFGAVFVSPWRFIGPIWWDIRRSLHCPGTRNSSLGAGATQFKSKKVDQRFFFWDIKLFQIEFSDRTVEVFFFRDFLAFSPAGHSAAAHFAHRLLRSESSFQKHLQQKELGHQDLGYGSDGQTSSVDGGDFRQVLYFRSSTNWGIYKETRKLCTFDL